MIKKEISFEDVKKTKIKVFGTGRSDYPNQINNVLVFPGIFRGALDSGAKQITEKIKLASYAYIASPHSNELIILDVITNPASPTLVGSYDAPGGGGNNGNGKSLYLVGNTLYFGRTLLSGNEFYILNNTNSETSLPVLGSKNILNGGNSSSVNGIIIRDYLAFLITNGEFQTFRIDDPTNITQYASPLTLPPGSGGGLQGTASDCGRKNHAI